MPSLVVLSTVDEEFGFEVGAPPSGVVVDGVRDSDVPITTVVVEGTVDPSVTGAPGYTLVEVDGSAVVVSAWAIATGARHSTPTIATPDNIRRNISSIPSSNPLE